MRQTYSRDSKQTHGDMYLQRHIGPYVQHDKLSLHMLMDGTVSYNAISGGAKN